MLISVEGNCRTVDGAIQEERRGIQKMAEGQQHSCCKQLISSKDYGRKLEFELLVGLTLGCCVEVVERIDVIITFKRSSCVGAFN